MRHRAGIFSFTLCLFRQRVPLYKDVHGRLKHKRVVNYELHVAA